MAQNQTLEQSITKDMLIGEVVAKYPQVIESLLAEGVHCVGCGASNWETLEQGLGGHGKSDKEIEDAIGRLNEVLKKNPVEAKKEFAKDATVKITQAAANKLNEIIKKEGKEGYGLRIAVRLGGCSGKSYELTFENNKEEGDKVIEVHGAKFYFDPNSLEELNGATVDFIETLQASGFKISNPNAKSTCGCGDSFS